MRYRTVYCDECKEEIKSGQKIHQLTWRKPNCPPTKRDELDFCSLDCIRNYFKDLIE